MVSLRPRGASRAGSPPKRWRRNALIGLSIGAATALAMINPTLGGALLTGVTLVVALRALAQSDRGDRGDRNNRDHRGAQDGSAGTAPPEIRTGGAAPDGDQAEPDGETA